MVNDEFDELEDGVDDVLGFIEDLNRFMIETATKRKNCPQIIKLAFIARISDEMKKEMEQNRGEQWGFAKKFVEAFTDGDNGTIETTYKPRKDIIEDKKEDKDDEKTEL